jgi:thiol-disulfide isomerase/thioredoxin
LTVFFTSCNGSKKTYQPTTTTIEGVITNPSQPSILLKSKEDVKAPIDQTGKFFLQTMLDKTAIYTLEYGGQKIKIFLVPGDNVKLQSNGIEFVKACSFTGSHANENNFLVQFENFKLQSEPQDFKAFFTATEPEFLKSVETRLQSFITFQQKYQKKNGPFDEEFAEMMSVELTYDAANMKMFYPEYFKYFYPDSTLVLSDTYDSFFQNLDLNSEEYLMVPSYKDFIGSYLHYKTNADTTSSNLSLNVKKFKNISNFFNEPEITQYLYYSLMQETITHSANDAAVLMEDYNKKQKNQVYLDEINTSFATIQHLIKGKVAPGFEYSTVSNQKLSLESLKGKVVYIDVWATWCGPCLKELPSLEKIEDQYKSEKDMVFVSISLDQDKIAWEKMVKEKNMSGIQLYADGAWSSKLAADYIIQSIPRFILIGKDGNIIDANTQRPSSSELVGLLDTALLAN